MSVLEVTRMKIKPGELDAFGAAMDGGRSVLLGAPGCNDVQVWQGVDEPDEVMVFVTWDSVEAHERFRSSASYRPFAAAITAHAAEHLRGAHFARRPDPAPDGVDDAR
jgi:heme-degrading monooxygenase HmoA